jgi:small-conductance mechanosensitive channel
MIENKTYPSTEILSDEVYFNQLDLLFELYNLKKQQNEIKIKLKELKKKVKRTTEEEVSTQFKALKFMSDEIKQKLKKVNSQIREPYNFFEINSQIQNINNYISELNKSFKRKEIDINTRLITFKYYKSQLDGYKKSLRRIRIVAEQYFFYLRNLKIELMANDSLMKKKMSRKKVEREEYEVIKKENSSKKDVNREVVSFLTEIILNFKPK